MTDNSKQNRAAAEFKKTQKSDDKALTGYEAEAAVVRAKTERLKALRLARDAAAGPTSTASPKAAAGRTKRTAKGKKDPTGTLAEWLADRQKDGHG